jgi:hypothetical protein
VVRSFIGSLIGVGPRDHAGLHRAACVAFAGASLPCQFMPMAIALAIKRGEAGAVRDATAHLRARLADTASGSIRAEEVPL